MKTLIPAIDVNEGDVLVFGDQEFIVVTNRPTSFGWTNLGFKIDLSQSFFDLQISCPIDRLIEITK